MEKTRQILALTKNMLIAVRRLSGDGLALSVSLRSPRPGCGSQRLFRCRSHPAGRGPNSSSLFPPLAAVVAVAPSRRGFGSPRKVNGFARGSPTRGAGERSETERLYEGEPDLFHAKKAAAFLQRPFL